MGNTPSWSVTFAQITDVDSCRRLEHLCREFEAAWREGRNPCIEDYLGQAEAAERPVLLRELLAIENDEQARGAKSRDSFVVPVDQRVRKPSGSLPPDPSRFPCGVPSRYELREEIAHGGEGVVYYGWDRDLDRDVAIKVPHPARGEAPEFVARFLNEARVCARLQHPSIIPIHEVGRLEDTRPFIAMKLIRGRTLAALLARRSDPSEERPRWLSVFGQVCQAVAFAHRQGVIHRDLKPGNVMVGAFGEVQVMDWGLAKELAEHEPDSPECENPPPHGPRVPQLPPGETEPGRVMGTPAYMSPEQASGGRHRLDARSDVFALGAILCEILTGEPPYWAVNSIRAHVKAQEANLDGAFERLDRCGADPELIGLARHFLAADPAHRPEHAGKASELFAAYQQSVEERLRQAQMERTRAETRAAEERKRRRAYLGLTAAVAMLLAVSGGVAFWIVRDRAIAAQRRNAANQTLAELEPRLAEFRGLATRSRDPLVWSDAHKLAGHAQALVDSGLADAALADAASVHLDNLRQEEEDRRLLDETDQLRLRRSEVAPESSKFNWQPVLPEYLGAFRRYGLAAEQIAAEVAAEQLLARPAETRSAIVTSLDFWLQTESSCGSRARAQWLLDVIQRADDDPWRRAVRQAGLAKDLPALKRLADEADVARQPAEMLDLLAWSFFVNRQFAEPLDLLQRARRQHAQDFWLNHDLAVALYHSASPQPEEAVRYYTAALAIRRCAAAHVNLGLALTMLNRLDEAAAEFRAALELSPKYAGAHSNLGAVRYRQRRLNEAAEEFEKAAALAPQAAGFHFNLGHARNLLGDHSRAIAAFEKGLALDDRRVGGHAELAEILYAQERYADALPHYERAFALLPRAKHDGGANDHCHWHAARCILLVRARSDASSPAEQSRWRGRVLELLRTELADFDAQAKEADTATLNSIRSVLGGWKQDPAFAVIRDRHPPETCSPTEREHFQRFWEDVDAMLARLPPARPL